MAKQSVRRAVLVALIATACIASLFDVASARAVRLELRGHHIALDDTASNTIASSRRVLNGIEDDFVMYKDTACDDDTIEKARALGDWESCRMWCSETPDCVAFDYNEKSSKCYLKGTWTKISAGNGHVSGVVKEKAEGIAAMAVGVLATAFQRMEDMECGGDEISDGILNGVESREQCEGACESRAAQGCRAYTWNKFNKRCYLKKDECVDENADIGRFSGRMMTISPDSAQQTVFGDSLNPNFKRMDDAECGGGEIPGGMIKGVESRESCEAACASRGTCKAYTWNSIDKRCYLKRDACVPESPDMGRFSGRLVEDAQSMAMDAKEETEDLVVDTIDESKCPETNPPSNRDFDEVGGKVCDGNEFDVIDLKDCYDAPTRENCGGECASNADCVSYSFDIYSKLCFLYSDDSCLTTSNNSIYESGLSVASDDGSYGSDYGSDY